MQNRRNGRWANCLLHLQGKGRIYNRTLGIMFIISCVITAATIFVSQQILRKPPRKSKNFFLDLLKLDSGLIVNATNCKIHDFDPWDSSLRPFYNGSWDWPPVVCCKMSYNWSTVEGNMLVIHGENMRMNGYNFYPGFCCYKAVSRVQQPEDNYNEFADSTNEMSSVCVQIEQERTVITAEYLVVQCASSPFPFGLPFVSLVYVGFHASISAGAANKPKVKEKVNFWETKAEDSTDSRKEFPPNVIIVGQDSTSRLNFRRFMPKTLSVLKRLGAVEMLGYTKAGENTFPNFLPIFNGYSEDDLVKICFSQPYVKQDNCPLVWKRFDRAKYLTAHIEDLPPWAGFHYKKTGFVKEPVDFYPRPLFFSDALHRDSWNGPLPYHKDCYGQFTTDDMILSYLENVVDFAKSSGTPLFATAWSTAATHNSVIGIQFRDATYHTFLNRLIHKGILDNTILIFMGDHGYRFGKVRETLLGFYEDKLPNMWIYLPPKIKKQFPEWKTNLQTNSRRLSSPFFLYWTFNQILQEFSSLPSPENAVNEITLKVMERQHRYSFLEEIPESVSCGDVGVPSELCACNPLRPVNLNDKKLLQAAKLAVDKINSKILVGSPCLPLTMLKLTSGASTVDMSEGLERITVGFVALPGEFIIEAEINFNISSKRFAEEVSVQRANKINPKDVACIDNAQKELFCFCPRK